MLQRLQLLAKQGAVDVEQTRNPLSQAIPHTQTIPFTGLDVSA